MLCEGKICEGSEEKEIQIEVYGHVTVTRIFSSDGPEKIMNCSVKKKIRYKILISTIIKNGSYGTYDSRNEEKS